MKITGYPGPDRVTGSDPGTRVPGYPFRALVHTSLPMELLSLRHLADSNSDHVTGLRWVLLVPGGLTFTLLGLAAGQGGESGYTVNTEILLT